MLKSRQKVVIDIANINMTLKQLLYWMEMKPDRYVDILDSRLARLGGWAGEVLSFLLIEDNPTVLKLTRRIYPMTDLEYYLAIYKKQMPSNVASSIKAYVCAILKINKLYDAYRDKEKGDRLKYLVDGLANDKVADLLQRAVDDGLLDEQFQPYKETNLLHQKTIAYAVCNIMNFPSREKWIHFDKQWSHMDRSLAHVRIPTGNRKSVERVMALYPEVDFKELLDKKYDGVFFSCKHTEESARYLYESLKRGNYISKSTTFSHFCSIFAKQKRRKPVEWTDNQLKLGYLVHHAFNKPYEKIWVTTVECFSIKGHKPHLEALKSNTAKALRHEREVDPMLLEIAEEFKDLSL